MRRVLLEALWEAGGKRSRASLCGEKQVGPGGPESVQPGLLVHHREPRASRQQLAGQDTLKSNDLWWMTLASAWVHGRVAAFISMIPFFLLSLSFLGWG